MTTIAQSVLSLSFGRRGRQRIAVSALRPSRNALPSAVSLGLICEPWEGLYLQDVDVELLQDAPRD